METNVRPNTFLTLDIYQTDDLRKWIGIYLHACRSRNLAGGKISMRVDFFERNGLMGKSVQYESGVMGGQCFGC